MNNLTILSNNVRVQDGLYSLNDLHKAAGSLNKHSPRYWSNNEQTKELVKEIEKDGIPSIVRKQRQGTWACKELVYAYAMWISAKFHLHVIRAFDKAQSLPIEHNSQQADKLQLINTMTQSMGLEEDVVILPTIDVMKMVQTIRGYQQAADLLKQNPTWIHDTIERVKTTTGRNVDL
ncbi:KilA-N domain-containing protein [Marinomonas transparens]|uniref:KilA-N domain-containing protein n=1 Tax=Marinomonas transparens TaxID=2795388 RepID=A0A934JRK8_9GAMM|nr:KilA-N domain-containing protein [Marinomonas transparens]MBJ7536976.1 KilA-N domain-containing protein [Marinomonas transparens]